MEAPQSFMSRINKLCIQMTHAGTKTIASASARKPCARWTGWWASCVTMPNATGICWTNSGQQTQWTQAQAQQVLGRMDQVLEQLPKARKQARQRILQGQAGGQ